MRAAVLQACGWLTVAASSLFAGDAPAPDRVSSDGAAIFRRAFWRHPTPADRILRAERREWGPEGQPDHWQWFIVVEPSDALVKHLRTDNAFALGPAPKATRPADAPDWWTWKEGSPILASRAGDLVLVFDDPARRLCASGTGHAPHPGAPEPEPKAAPSSNPAGRLPPTSPPKPEP